MDWKLVVVSPPLLRKTEWWWTLAEAWKQQVDLIPVITEADVCVSSSLAEDRFRPPFC